MPVGTAFHERTFPLCHSLNYREWSGYYTVSVYEVHHEHEYNAIRNAAALIDISPLYKYLITGKDATKLVNLIAIVRPIYSAPNDPDVLGWMRKTAAGSSLLPASRRGGGGVGAAGGP